MWTIERVCTYDDWWKGKMVALSPALNNRMNCTPIRLTPSCGNVFDAKCSCSCLCLLVCARSLWTFANYVHLFHSIEIARLCFVLLLANRTHKHTCLRSLLILPPKQCSTSKKCGFYGQWNMIFRLAKWKQRPIKSECITDAFELRFCAKKERSFAQSFIIAIIRIFVEKLAGLHKTPRSLANCECNSRIETSGFDSKKRK